MTVYSIPRTADTLLRKRCDLLSGTVPNGYSARISSNASVPAHGGLELGYEAPEVGLAFEEMRAYVFQHAEHVIHFRAYVSRAPRRRGAHAERVRPRP